MKIEVGRKFFAVPTVNLVRMYGKDAREATIVKVGRKYFYAKIEGVYGQGDDGEEKFDKKSLRSEHLNSSWIAYSSMQEIEDKEEASRLCEEFRKFFDWTGKSHELTLKQLRAIKAIIDGNADED